MKRRLLEYEKEDHAQLLQTIKKNKIIEKNNSGNLVLENSHTKDHFEYLPIEILFIILDYLGGLFIVTFSLSKKWNQAFLEYYRRLRKSKPQSLASNFFSSIRCCSGARNVSYHQMEKMCIWFKSMVISTSYPHHAFLDMLTRAAIVGKNPDAIRWIYFNNNECKETGMLKTAFGYSDYTSLKMIVKLRCESLESLLKRNTCPIQEIFMHGNVELFEELTSKHDLLGLIKNDPIACAKLASLTLRYNNPFNDSPFFQSETFLKEFFNPHVDKRCLILNSLDKVAALDNPNVLRQLMNITYSPNNKEATPNMRELWEVFVPIKLLSTIPKVSAYFKEKEGLQTQGRNRVLETTKVLEFLFEELNINLDGIVEHSCRRSRYSDAKRLIRIILGIMISKMYLRGCKYIYEKWWIPMINRTKKPKTECTFAIIDIDDMEIMNNQKPKDEWMYSVSSTNEMCQWISDQQKEFPLFVTFGKVGILYI